MELIDIQKIESYKRHIAWLKSVGDDQANMQERHEFYDKIKVIKNKYETPQSIARKLLQQEKAYHKRVKIAKAKEKEERTLLKTLTPKQVAINKVCELNYILQSIRIDFYRAPNQSCKDHCRDHFYKTNKKKAELMKEWKLKSTDIRRQKKFNSIYL
jgi:homoserine trans-succinylase